MNWNEQLLDRLDEAFEPTPRVFHQRFEAKLGELADEKPKGMHRGIRLALAAALCVLLLWGAALALNRLGVVYFLTERIYNGPDSASVEPGILPPLSQACESTLVQAEVRELWMQENRLAMCFHLSPREPESYRLLSETDIGTDGEHFDQIWWNGEILSFEEWLPQGKQMLIVTPLYLQIGQQRLPASLDWVPEAQGETFLMEGDLSRLLNRNEALNGDGTLTVQAVVNVSVYDGDTQEQAVLSATVKMPDDFIKEEQP